MMMGPPVRVEAPAALPVTLEELRRYCRVSDDDDDAHIERLARSATARLDGYAGYLGRAIINQAWRQDFDAFPHPRQPKLRLRLPDVSSATIVSYGDDGGELTSPIGEYVVHRDFIGWFVLPRTGGHWPAGRGAVIYTAGYGEKPDQVDDAVREAIGMMVQASYRLTGEDAALRSESIDGASSMGYFGPEIMGNAVAAHIKALLKDARWRP